MTIQNKTTINNNPTLFARSMNSPCLFETENVIDTLNDEENDWLPGDQVANPIEQIAIEHVRFLHRREDDARYHRAVTHVITSHGLGNNRFRSTFSLQYGQVCFFPTMHQPRMQNS